MSTNRVQLNEGAIALPYAISQSGSYVLTSDLIDSKGLEGIIIDADGVAPAAILGLYEVAGEKQAEIVGLETPTSDMETRRVALEQILGRSTHNSEEGDRR